MGRGTSGAGAGLCAGTRAPAPVPAQHEGEQTDAWTREKLYYRPRPVPDFSTTGDWRDVGHYTQMVWHNVTAIGCAVTSNDQDDYLVCRYSPPGNIYGRTIFGAEK